jgi:hypothetical protein
MSLTNLTSSDLAKIAKLLKRKESLLQRVAKIDRALSAFETGKPVARRGRRPGRRMSAATRAKMAAAAKARWAKIKAQQGK